MQGPVVSLSWLAKIAVRNFYEAIIQRKVVANGIQQLQLIPVKIREAHHNELIDLVQCPHAVWGTIDGHCNQCNVRKWRLHFFGQIRFASRLHSGWFAGWTCNVSVVSICVEAFYIGGEALGLDGSIKYHLIGPHVTWLWLILFWNWREILRSLNQLFQSNWFFLYRYLLSVKERN